MNCRQFNFYLALNELPLLLTAVENDVIPTTRSYLTSSG